MTLKTDIVPIEVLDDLIIETSSEEPPRIIIIKYPDDLRWQNLIVVYPNEIQPLREALATAAGLLAEAATKGGDVQ